METDNAGHLFTVTHPNSNPALQDLTSVIGRDRARPNLVPHEIAEEDHHSRGADTRKTISLQRFDVYLGEFFKVTNAFKGTKVSLSIFLLIFHFSPT